MAVGVPVTLMAGPASAQAEPDGTQAYGPGDDSSYGAGDDSSGSGDPLYLEPGETCRDVYPDFVDSPPELVLIEVTDAQGRRTCAFRAVTQESDPPAGARRAAMRHELRPDPASVRLAWMPALS